MRTEATTDANCMMLNDMAGISIFYPEPTYSCRLKKALPAEAADAAPTLSSTNLDHPARMNCYLTNTFRLAQDFNLYPCS